MNHARLTRILKIALIIYNLILVIMAISHLEFFRSNWPFVLFTSFIPIVIILTPIALILAYFIWRVEFFSLIFWSGLVLFPFIVFDKYVTPDGAPCAKNCISILSANIRHDLTALDALAGTEKTKAADLIILQDIPGDISSDVLSGTYRNHGFSQIFNQTENGETLGSVIAIISKTEIPTVSIFEVYAQRSTYAPRIFLKLSYPISSNETIELYALHPTLPITRDRMKFRNRMFDQLKSELGGRQNFILVGDFNMTPWEAKFDELSGHRIGDPRWVSTWDANRPWLRLAIDHFMIGDDLRAVEGMVLPGIGSDHYPIWAVVRFGG